MKATKRDPRDMDFMERHRLGIILTENDRFNAGLPMNEDGPTVQAGGLVTITHKGKIMPDKSEKQVSIRLPEFALDHAEALIGVLAALPEYAAFRVERATVLKIALMRGLAEIGREHHRNMTE
jgi:hypothetical protein